MIFFNATGRKYDLIKRCGYSKSKGSIGVNLKYFTLGVVPVNCLYHSFSYFFSP